MTWNWPIREPHMLYPTRKCPIQWVCGCACVFKKVPSISSLADQDTTTYPCLRDLKRTTMAEAAGLALGAVALVSLFSTSVELMDYFELGKSFECDYPLACSKLSLLQRRLEITGQTLGISEDSPWDEKLWKPMTHQEAVINTSLQSIIDVFGNAEILKSKYSLLPRKPSRINTLSAQGSHTLAAKQNTGPFSLRHFQQTSLRRTTIWAIRDKRKFDLLIADLEFFISNLEAVASNLHMAPVSSKNTSKHYNANQPTNDSKIIDLARSVRSSTETDFARPSSTSVQLLSSENRLSQQRAAQRTSVQESSTEATRSVHGTSRTDVARSSSSLTQVRDSERRLFQQQTAQRASAQGSSTKATQPMAEDKPSRRSHTEQRQSWITERAEKRSGVFYGVVGETKLRPAPEDQSVSYRVGTATDDARVVGGAMSETSFDRFMNNGPR